MEIASQFVCKQPVKLWGWITTPWKCGGILRTVAGNPHVLRCEECGKDSPRRVDNSDLTSLLGKAFLMVAAMIVLATTIVHAQQIPRPDPVLTPGLVDSVLTRAKLCDPQFHTGTIRSVTESEKKAVCQAYGITAGCPGKGYELDHLVSLEIGGKNGPQNLWPQPVDAVGIVGYRTKDKVENAAHKAVCDGRISLDDAQKGIIKDWYRLGVTLGVLSDSTAHPKAGASRPVKK